MNTMFDVTFTVKHTEKIIATSIFNYYNIYWSVRFFKIWDVSSIALPKK